jgi:hypothetical protein
VIRARGAPYVHWPGHPLATSGYVPVLRLAASDAGLGRDREGRPTRWLTRGQTVQPIDGDPWNWRRSNLRVGGLADGLPRAVRGTVRAARSAKRLPEAPKAPKMK